MKNFNSQKGIAPIIAVLIIVVVLAVVVIPAFVRSDYFMRTIGLYMIKNKDTAGDKRRVESHYKEFSKRYEVNGEHAFPIDYRYNVEKNIGSFSVGGFTGNGCNERIIRDSFTTKEIVSVSLCVGEIVTKEKLVKLDEYWKKHKELFNY